MVDLISPDDLSFYYIVEGNDPTRPHKLTVIMVISSYSGFCVVTVNKEKINLSSPQKIYYPLPKFRGVRITCQNFNFATGFLRREFSEKMRAFSLFR